jgi:hypothetical protein
MPSNQSRQKWLKCGNGSIASSLCQLVPDNFQYRMGLTL